MIVNAAIFTCSICGEASHNICSYCTKDACANHRCERCKRCSDCCECEVPLSAEEPVEVEAVTEPVLQAEFALPQVEAPAPEDVPEPEAELSEPDAEISEAETEIPEPQGEPIALGFLTPEEASVFAEPSRFIDPKLATNFDQPTEPEYPENPNGPRDSTEPRE